LQKKRSREFSPLIGEGKYFSCRGRTVSGKRIVVKKSKALVSEQDARDAISLHEKYIRFLGEAGINLPKTEARFYGEGKGYRLVFFQERFAKKEIIGAVLKGASKARAKLIFGKILDQALSLASFNHKMTHTSKSYANIDFYLNNLAFRNGKVFLIDTFFPFMVLNGKKPSKLSAKFGGKEPRFEWLHDLASQHIVPADVKPVVRVYLSMAMVRPDLAKDFEVQMEETVKKRFSGSGKSRLLHWTSPSRLKAVKAYFDLLRKLQGGRKNRAK